MKRLKKSEFAIYAIALMLVAAGYFNYSTFQQETQETYSEDIQEVNEKYANVGDAVLVSNNEVDTTDNQNEIEVSADNVNNEEQKNDYYVSSKLNRDTMYAEMISNYEKVINNANASEAQKSIATQEITKINNTKNAIMICENLLMTKGFEKCLILVNEKNINIVVNVEGGLEKEKVAKIQNIVSREFECQIENIHICYWGRV